MDWTELEMISELKPSYYGRITFAYQRVLLNSLISTLVAIFGGVEFHSMTRLHTDFQTNSDFIKLRIIDY